MWSWWQAQLDFAGAAGDAGWDGDQLAAEPCHGAASPAVAVIEAGDFLEPGAERAAKQPRPHPYTVHGVGSGGQVTKRRAVFGVAIQFFDVGPVSVPPLNFGEVFLIGDVEVGQDEGVPVDLIDTALQSQGELVLSMVRRFRARVVGMRSTGMRVRRAMQAMFAFWGQGPGR